MSDSWKKIASDKRDAVNALIPSDWVIVNPPSREAQKDVTGKFIHQYLSKQEIEITETDAVGIASKTTSGQWKALTVIKSFAHRAALAHQLTNCLLEIFFEAAFVHAQELDDYYAANGRPVGPLHGLPVSLKDQFHVKDVDTTMGYVGWIGTFQGRKNTNREKIFESELVKELNALGAVLYCKTSVPHTLMAGESNNNIMGYVWNPKNRLLSAGGSSGGEGALIGLRGSPIGFGTDIGGSVRIPAAFNGLYGIRPSSGRLPYEGMANSMDGQNSILSVIGPIATSLEALSFMIQAVLSQKPWLHDPLVVEMPWREEPETEIQKLMDSKSKLAFGVMRNDGIITPYPPVQRAVEKVVKIMESLNHEIVDWKPTPTHDHLYGIVMATWTYDGGADVHEAFALSGETPVPQIAAVYGSKAKQEVTASKISRTNIAKREAQKEYMEYWNSTAGLTNTGRPVDAIIAPVAPCPAAFPETFRYVGYSSWVNVLDYTAVVIPVTTVDKHVDHINDQFEPLSDDDEKSQQVYDPEIFEGAHVSIQLVGRRYQEERLLAIAGYVSKALAAQE